MKNLILSSFITIILIACNKDNKKTEELETKIENLENEVIKAKELEYQKKITELENENSNLKKQEINEKNIDKRLAIINDPDGYTNVRNGMSINSKIIDRLYEGETYVVYPTKNSNWWKVQTQSNIEGYVHQSRIKIIK